MLKWRRKILVLCSTLALALFTAPPAHALLILDNMVFIGPKAGAATFKIKNTGKEPEAYRLQWTQLKMIPTGAKKDVQPGEIIPGLMPAEPYMFMAPRRLMLMPDQLQQIRFMVRRMKDMPPGEYRSYLVLQPEEVPAEYRPGENNPAASAPGKKQVNLSVLSGFRIPVFFLHGETSLKVSAVNAGYGLDPKGRKGFYFTFVREGNRSALGDVEITCDVDGKPVKLGGGQIRIFTELSARNYFYNSNEIPAGCHTAAIKYLPHTLDPDYTGQKITLAEIPLN